MQKIDFTSQAFQKRTLTAWGISMVVCLLFLGIAVYADLSAFLTQVLFFVGFLTGAGSIFFLVVSLLSGIIRFLSGVKDKEINTTQD